MAPRKRAAKAAAKAGGKKAKVTKQEAAADKELKGKVAQLKKSDSFKKKTSFAVDSCVTLGGVTVYKDYNCMLNQTNIGQNNNKYYVVQLLTDGSKFHVFTRWGRVGEPGANATKSFADEEAAIKEFSKKFSDKSKNKWDDRANFIPVPGKYTLIEVEQIDDSELAETARKLEALEEADGTVTETKPCTLDKPTQGLIELIFDNNMFEEQMVNFELDVKKMPLGKLSKVQIAKGFDVLEKLKQAIDGKKPAKKLQELSSEFYTVIPHSFGRKIPPTINTQEVVQTKMDMLMVLGDIELALSMQIEKSKPAKKATKEVPHPLDVKVSKLQCGLDHLKPKTAEYKILEKYVKSTGQYRELLHVWKVDRHGEDKRFAEHDTIDNRRLLWHGTNVAVVAAILNSGLRIMPHSGGRVGRGIYFASEHSKSAGYVRTTNQGVGIMFLNEVALGKEHNIARDDCSLRNPPAGHDCIIARGRREPDPSKDTVLKIGGRDVKVPQGAPISQDAFLNSSFWQSEYLIYKESQNRIRYLLQFKLH